MSTRAAARRRSAAAIKGWETRRRNAEHAKRSAAARKGWETRRRNTEHAKRSAVARKGWETRRASERAVTGGRGRPRGTERFSSEDFIGRDEPVSRDEIDETRESQGYEEGGRYAFDQDIDVDYGDYDDDFFYDDLIGADEEEGS